MIPEIIDPSNKLFIARCIKAFENIVDEFENDDVMSLYSNRTSKYEAHYDGCYASIYFGMIPWEHLAGDTMEEKEDRLFYDFVKQFRYEFEAMFK